MAHAVRSCFFGLVLLLGSAFAVAQDGVPEGSVHGSVPSAFGLKGFYMGPSMGAAFNAGVNDWTGRGFTGAQKLAQELGQNRSEEAFTGGLIIGYQVPLQTLVPHWTAPIVLGPEVDINYVGELRKHDSFTFVNPAGGLAPPGTYTLTTGRESNYFGTIRSHIGYLFADNKAQVYLSGGFAFAGNSGGASGNVTYTSPTGTRTVLTRSGSSSHTGGVFGAGGEYSFHPQLSARLELLYVQLKTNSHTFTAPGSGNQYFISNDAKGHFTIIRAGLTYHF